ncbi:MAG TPA: GNAT family N-acetyltransferase [Candidatus Binataceae bacterium]|nr:GNAT family N-acetyltransferase [Candidatus Binataceae bacterium]
MDRSNSSVQIRRIRKSDLSRLRELYDQLHLKNYLSLRVSKPKLAAAFDRLARDRNHTILVAEVAGQLVGTCHVIVVPHLGHALKPLAIVENVVVDANARSTGIGQHLMEAAGDLARRRGCYKIALTSNIARPRAHRFYERLGWTRTHFGYSLGLE